MTTATTLPADEESRLLAALARLARLGASDRDLSETAQVICRTRKPDHRRRRIAKLEEIAATFRPGRLLEQGR